MWPSCQLRDLVRRLQKLQNKATFQKIGLASPLRVHRCPEAPRQLLPQRRDQDGSVVARTGHRPHVLAAENISLAQRTCGDTVPEKWQLCTDIWGEQMKYHCLFTQHDCIQSGLARIWNSFQHWWTWVSGWRNPLRLPCNGTTQLQTVQLTHKLTLL